MSDTDASAVGQRGVERRIVREPTDTTAGVAVTHHPNPGPHETEYTVEQLWANGEADPVFVGDDEDALYLIQLLTEAIRDE